MFRPLSFLILSYLLLLLLLRNITKAHGQDTSTPPPKFPAILVFGDSTVDTGNNNYIPTAFRANHAPYGVDYTRKEATGRFSDGLLVPDFLASDLGIKPLLPPFLKKPSLSDDDIRTGVCFASAGSGFDPLTTAASGVIPVSRQPDMFKQYISKLKGVAGGQKEANEIVGNALFLISAATNDFVFNWYDIPSRRISFGNISSYQGFLQRSLRVLIKDLYDLGGRKFAIAGLPQIGCVPIQMTAKFGKPSTRKCIEEQNSDSVAYNDKLRKLLPEIQASLQESKLAYIDLYSPVMDILTNPSKYGMP
ncbi:hypothetical protein ACLOJK_023270 [Asimina triloba]